MSSLHLGFFVGPGLPLALCSCSVLWDVWVPMLMLRFAARLSSLGASPSWSPRGQIAPLRDRGNHKSSVISTPFAIVVPTTSTRWCMACLCKSSGSISSGSRRCHRVKTLPLGDKIAPWGLDASAGLAPFGERQFEIVRVGFTFSLLVRAVGLSFYVKDDEPAASPQLAIAAALALLLAALILIPGRLCIGEGHLGTCGVPLGIRGRVGYWSQVRMGDHGSVCPNSCWLKSIRMRC